MGNIKAPFTNINNSVYYTMDKKGEGTWDLVDRYQLDNNEKILLSKFSHAIKSHERRNFLNQILRSPKCAYNTLRLIRIDNIERKKILYAISRSSEYSYHFLLDLKLALPDERDFILEHGLLSRNNYYLYYFLGDKECTPSQFDKAFEILSKKFDTAVNLLFYDNIHLSQEQLKIVYDKCINRIFTDTTWDNLITYTQNLNIF